MKSATGYIWNVWNAGGPFIGDARAHTVVTIEPDWELTSSFSAHDSVVRDWFSHTADQIEVPGVRTVSIDRTVDADVSTCDIVINNTKMDPNSGWDPGKVPGLQNTVGNPGYYSYKRGSSAFATGRWGHLPNAWSNRFVPNTLVRTYQGFGGFDKTLAQALTDGNLVATGTWLIDEVAIDTSGVISLKCRDMAKLLIEQFIYTPLVPVDWYPLRYARFKPTLVHFPAVQIYNFLRPREVSLAGVNKYVVDIIAPADGDGYWVIGNDGGVFSYGPHIQFHGSLGATTLAHPIKCATAMPDGTGYWLMDFNGTVFPFGAAVNYGDLTGDVDITDIGSTSTGLGYWILKQDGSIFAYGDAGYYGGSPALTGGDTISAFAPTATDLGYWLVSYNDGAVFAYGDAVYAGGGGLSTPVPEVTYQAEQASFTAPTVVENQFTGFQGSGYLAFWKDSSQFIIFTVHANFGGQYKLRIRYSSTSGTDRTLTINADSPSTVSFPSSGAYDTFIELEEEVTLDVGENIIKLQGNDDDYVNLDSITVLDAGNGKAVDIAGVGVDGYYILFSTQQVGDFGTAPSISLGEFPKAVLQDRIPRMAKPSDKRGFWLVGNDGGVFTFGELGFWGSLPGPFDLTGQVDGNYLDYTDIIKQLLRWSGFALNDGVFGLMETTGAYNPEAFPEDTWDKKSIVDCINLIKEIVGYRFWCDEDGAANFRYPNWERLGNILPDGTRSDYIPDIDERINLVTHATRLSDASVRSEIIISSNQLPAYGVAPDPKLVTTRYTPVNFGWLHNMVRPAMWVNDYFNSPVEQLALARLIDVHAVASIRMNSMTCVANPLIQVDDQVFVQEATTSEAHVHYVRSVRTNHDLDSGLYTMDLQTNWLGDTTEWFFEGVAASRVNSVSPEIIVNRP